VLGTGVLSVGVQEIENDKVKEREGYFGKAVRQNVVGWWDVSSGAQAGARKEAFEKVRKAAGGSPEGVKGEWVEKWMRVELESALQLNTGRWIVWVVRPSLRIVSV
jgi:hypothetical protein